MKTEFKIRSLSNLNESTVKITLDPLTDFKYKVGQHIYLPMATKTLPFSIASTPNDGKWIEIHIGGLTGDSPIDSELEPLRLKFLLGKTIFIGEAKGHAWLRESKKPLVLVAGGSGYTYTRGMIYHELDKSPVRNITLYWGAKSKSDLYEFDELVRLSKNNFNFNFIAVTENMHMSDFIAKGKLLDVFFDTCNLSNNPDIYICGRYEMVKSAKRLIDNFCDGYKCKIRSDVLPDEE
jgi:NAD(P)H-flavin reductase